MSSRFPTEIFVLSVNLVLTVITQFDNILYFNAKDFQNF